MKTKNKPCRSCHVWTLPRLISALSLSWCQFVFPRQKPQPFISVTMKIHFQATLPRIPPLWLLDNHLSCKWLLLLWSVPFIPLSSWKAFSESSPLDQGKKNLSVWPQQNQWLSLIGKLSHYYKFKKQQGFALLSKACKFGSSALIASYWKCHLYQIF